MFKLAVNNPLFEKLSLNPPQWWNALVNDMQISIQIRKNNYIDVYFNGGCIIHRLTFDGHSFDGGVHYKYIPIKNNNKDYVPFLFKNEKIGLGQIEVMPLNDFGNDSLKRIKENISKHFPSSSEKAIQYGFIQHDPYFIDSEFEYSYKDSDKTKTIRIDLVRLDKTLRKIVFVEVKTMGDRRLYNNEITTQLQDYKNFIVGHKHELLMYYKKVWEIKRKLRLLPEHIANEEIDDYEILDKPLLLFGDCKQDWINKNSKAVDDRIRTHAIGSYYFGEPKHSCDIVKKTYKNRHIF